MKNLLYLTVWLCSLSAFAQNVAFIDQGQTFQQPVDVTGAGDNSGRLFVVEKVGTIRILNQDDQSLEAADFLDLTDRVLADGERGLLGLAFHPDYAANGLLYVNYTANASTGLVGGTTVIAQFTNTDPSSNVVDASTEVQLLTVPQLRGNHNAGDLAFGPDGFLYIPLGDSGGAGDPDAVAQEPDELLGKMLRIDVNGQDPGLNYSIPSGNPYVGNTDTLPEIWSFGLRNPWRISFDRLTGDLWIGDVGQDEREEINFQAAGAVGGQNYGWNCREGLIAFNGSTRSVRCNDGQTFVEPVFDYAHPAVSGRSVTGGFVYRGTSAPALVGTYIAADFLTNRIYLLDPPVAGVSTATTQDQSDVTSITAFGEDDEGNLFVLSNGGGLFEVVTEAVLPVQRTSWTAELRGKTAVLSWQTASEFGARDFVVERSSDGQTFRELAVVAATGAENTAADYRYVDAAPNPGTNFYRIQQRDQDGSGTTWPVRTVVVDDPGREGFRITPNPTSRLFRISADLLPGEGEVDIQVIDATGRTVLRADGTVESLSRQPIDLRGQVAGRYVVRLVRGDRVYVQSLILR